jgi:hypothetical protein
MKSIASAAIVRTVLAVLATSFLIVATARGATSGSISGAVSDKSGAVVAGAMLKLVNTARQTTYQTISDKQGFYSFPNLPVGHYDLTTTASSGYSSRRANSAKPFRMVFGDMPITLLTTPTPPHP